jgi:hypothetical protein
MHQRYHEKSKQRLQGEHDIVALPSLDPKTGSRVSLVFNVGRAGMGHDNASKKVTVLTCVVVISTTQGFCYGLAVDPKIQHMRREKSCLPATVDEVS